MVLALVERRKTPSVHLPLQGHGQTDPYPAAISILLLYSAFKPPLCLQEAGLPSRRLCPSRDAPLHSREPIHKS